jgi:hypothetical protein
MYTVRACESLDSIFLSIIRFPLIKKGFVNQYKALSSNRSAFVIRLEPQSLLIPVD